MTRAKTRGGGLRWYPAGVASPPPPSSGLFFAGPRRRAMGTEPGLWTTLLLPLLGLLLFVVRPALQKLQTSSPPILELSTDLNIFTDPVSGGYQGTSGPQKRYFRYLSVDPTNENYLYAGSVDHVYRLDASYISENYLKSSNLSQSAIGAINDHLANCLGRRKDPILSCQNHVRAVIRVDKTRLFVCTTGIDSPMVYYLNYSNLDVISLDQKGGRAKCPYDPSSNYTIVYVENGNPGGVPTTYSGTVTDFSNSDSVIYRPPLTGPDAKEYRLLRTEQDSRWLNDPQFVGSFDVGEHVIFFFREQAMENANCGKVTFSRVARICKRDEGGSSLSMDYRWTTFLKARLNCSVPGDEMPFYFNEIYDVSYNQTEQTFYGLFRTIQGGFWGSAVCSFTVAAINRVFDESPFKGQQNFETGWFPIPERDTPSPRPGQCRYSSLDLSTSALSFVKSHPLLHATVDARHGRPLYVTKDDLALTRLAVHTVGDHKVFFLGSSRGVVYKAAQWLDDGGQVQFVTIAILKPFRNVIRPIWQMLIHTISAFKTTYLYLSTDDAVVQLQTEDCFRYARCQSCLVDPYCTWNAQMATCQPHHSNTPKQMFNVIDEVCNRACQPSHKPYTSTREILQGVPLHLNCTPACLPPPSSSSSSSGGATVAAAAKVIWHFSDASSARLVKIDYAEFVLSQDLGLVILDVRGQHNGTFSCSVNGYIIARHQVKVLPCRLSASKEETWRQEFTRWCNAFSAYTQEYNNWVCLKKQCLKEKCIPQKVSDKCHAEKLSPPSPHRP